MTHEPSPAGRQLLALLPEVYRTRDRDAGHLAAYLDACGELLDLIRNTLDQRLADSFPDEPHRGLAAQGWLLPYFAQLLDARLLSPHLDGRRAEVSQAVSWRQRKGTTPVIEQIAEAVAQLDVEVQEGWKRVATTPRIGLPLLPAAAFGLAPEPDRTNPLAAARHPGLPAVTVDVRYPSRAVATDSGHPAVRGSGLGASPLYWRQAHPLGAPCFPDSYQDASRRTVDLRTPSFKDGHYHPRRLLLFAPPPTGFFPVPALTFPLAADASPPDPEALPPRQVRLTWAQRNQPDGDKYIKEEDPVEAEIVHHVFNPSLVDDAEDAPVAVTVTSSPLPWNAPLEVLRIEDLNFLGTLTVNSGRVELRRVAAKRLTVVPIDGAEPVIDAVDCLFETIEVKDAPIVSPSSPPVELTGLVRLEHCTVLGSLKCQRLQASDCLLSCTIELSGAGDAASCVRHSRIPPELTVPTSPPLELDTPETTTDEPVFYDFAACDGGSLVSPEPFGSPGCAVLHPATPDSICFGAENGAEMGAYHHLGYCAQRAAVLEKVHEFLPVGIEAVLIPDSRLLTAPPVEL